MGGSRKTTWNRPSQQKKFKFVTHVLDHFALLTDDVDGNVGGADLLRDASGLAVLNIGSPELVENLGLSGVDVTCDEKPIWKTDSMNT